MEFAGDRIVVVFPNNWAREYFRTECLADVKRGLDHLAEREIEVVFRVDSVEEIIRDRASDPKSQPLSGKSPSLTQGEKSPYIFKPIPGFTFEEFVVGESNRDVVEAAWAFVKWQGGCRTLCITGLVGTGKSHVMGAIYEYAGRVYPNLKILPCLLAKDFRGEFSRLARENNQFLWDTFNEKYFRSNMVLIDDIQRLAGAIQTMAQLKDIVDAVLSRKDACIILTSQPSLKDLEKMFMDSVDKDGKDVLAKTKTVTELISRLRAFLTVEIKRPDFDLKVEILVKKASEGPVPFKLDIELAREIARRVTIPDIRLLVGIINSLKLKVSRGAVIDLKLINELLEDVPQKKLDAEAITKTAAEHFGVSVEAIKSDNKMASVVRDRRTAFYLCRKLLPQVSTTDLGRFFKKDHSTVIQGASDIEREKNTNAALVAELLVIEGKILL